MESTLELRSTKTDRTAQFQGSVANNLRYWRQKVGSAAGDPLQAMDREWENVRRAVQFGLGGDGTWRDAARLVNDCFMAIEQRGAGADWIPFLEQLVSRCGEDDLALRGHLLNSLGSFYRRERRLDGALRAHREEEAIGRRLQDKSRLAHARLNLCKLYWMQRAYDKAERYGRTALQLFSDLGGNPEKMAPTFNQLGLVAHHRGDLAAARHYLAQAVETFRHLPQPINLARALLDLANAQQAAADNDQALRNYQEAAALLEPTDSELDKTKVQLSLGTLYLNLGRLQEAEAAYRRANSTFLRQSGRTYYQALAALNLGNLYLARDQLSRAEAYLSEAAALYRQTDDQLMLANTLGDLAQTRALRGSVTAARTLYEEALALAAKFPDDAWGRDLVSAFREALERLRDG